MYSLLIALIYLIFISLGLPDSLLGAGWPTMRLEFDMPVAAAGIISMIVSFGTICSSLMSERMTKKTSPQFVTIVSVIVTAAAMLGYSFATSFWMLCLLAVPYGLGAGAVDSVINNYVALHYGSRHMSWLHCFWGVGTIISPYIMSAALTHSTWNMGYRTVSFLQFGIALILILTLRAWNVNKKTDGAKESANILGIKGAVKIKGAPTLFIGFFAYCAAEATAMLWSSSFLVNIRHIDKETAAAFAALFYIGITVGRFISGIVSDRIGDRGMIRIGTAVAAVSVVCMVLPIKSDIPAFAGLVLFGLGCAPIYPSIIHSTPANFGEENSQAIIGMQMASAYSGATFMPPLLGIIAGKTTLAIFPYFIAFFFILMTIMLEKTNKTVDKYNNVSIFITSNLQASGADLS